MHVPQIHFRFHRIPEQFGAVVSDDTIMHILGGDNFILFSDSVEELRKQLHGLANNVNETKSLQMRPKLCPLVQRVILMR